MSKNWLILFLGILSLKAFSQTIITDFYSDNGLLKDVCLFDSKFFFIDFPSDTAFEIKIITKDFNTNSQRSFSFNGPKPYFKEIIVNSSGVFLFGQLNKNTKIKAFDDLHSSTYGSFFVLKFTRTLSPVKYYILDKNDGFNVFSLPDKFVISFDDGTILNIDFDLKVRKIFRRNFVLTDIVKQKENYYASGYFKTNKNKAFALFLLNEEFIVLKSKEFLGKNNYPVDISMIEDRIILSGYLNGNLKLDNSTTLTKKYPARNIFILSLSDKFDVKDFKIIESPADMFLYDFYIPQALSVSDTKKLYITGSYKNSLFYNNDTISENNGENITEIKPQSGGEDEDFATNTYNVFVAVLNENFVLEDVIRLGTSQDAIPRFIYKDENNLSLALTYKNFISFSQNGSSDTIGNFYFPYNYLFLKLTCCSQPVSLFASDSVFVNFPYYLTPDTDKDFILYDWNDNYATTEGIWVKSEGMYYLTVRDEKGCFHTDSVKVITDKSKALAVDNNFELRAAIFPNPTTHDYFILQINTFKKENLNLEIFDAQSRLLRQETLNLSRGLFTKKILLPENYQGLFIVKITTENKTLTLKGIKQ